MYNIEDKVSAVRTLQKYLKKIYGDETSLNQNGILDDNTLIALNRFQRENGFSIEAYADFKSFDAIYDAYITEVIREKTRKFAHDTTFPLKRGDQSYSVLLLNTMLREILDYYSMLHYTPKTDYFSFDTEKSARIIREILGFDDSDTIDELLYSRILMEWKSINKIKSE
jgi:hypothetical protein